MIWLQPSPWSCFVASLDKTPYDDYLCLVASNKQLIQWQEFEEIHKNTGSVETLKQVDSYNHEVVIAIKSARIVQ